MPADTHYCLKSKDLPLVDFVLHAEETTWRNLNYIDYTVEIQNIHKENAHLMPPNLPEHFGSDDLMRWLQFRKAPNNRVFVQELMELLYEHDNPLAYSNITHALSLNDAYWVENKALPLKWDDINLYEHSFDELLACVAFTGAAVGAHKLRDPIVSPEYTTNGVLAKCWINENGGIFLIKTDNVPLSKGVITQAHNEFYAAQIAEALGLKHINYELEIYRHKNQVDDKEYLVCKCPLFTTKDVGFIDADTYFHSKGIKVSSGMSTFKKHIQLAEAFGEDHYADIMLFDSIIGNIDRHVGNFGMLRDNNTGKIIGPAPIFDSGMSFFVGHEENKIDEKFAQEFGKDSRRCTNFSQDAQAAFFVRAHHVEKLKKLLNFKFRQPKDPRCALKENTIRAMEYFVRSRASRTLHLYHAREAGEIVFLGEDIILKNESVQQGQEHKESQATKQNLNTSWKSRRARRNTWEL